MRLFIKNMHTRASINWLREVLNELSIPTVGNIRAGEVELAPDTEEYKLPLLIDALKTRDMYILTNHREQLAEKIKNLIIEVVEKDELPEQNYSDYITSKLNLNYSYLANIFSDVEEITVERFIIEERVRKAIHLLQTNQHTIGEIARKMHYSSMAHFSNQFKKVTSYTPSEYKRKLQNEL